MMQGYLLLISIINNNLLNNFKIIREKTVKIMSGEKSMHETSSLPSEKFLKRLLCIVE